MSPVFSKPYEYGDIFVNSTKDQDINTMIRKNPEEIFSFSELIQLLAANRNLILGEVPIAFLDETGSIRFSLSHQVPDGSEDRAFITVMNEQDDTINVKVVNLQLSEKKEASKFIKGLDVEQICKKTSDEISFYVKSMEISHTGEDTIKVPTAVFIPGDLFMDLLVEVDQIIPELFLKKVVHHVQMGLLEINPATVSLLAFAISRILQGSDNTCGSVTLSDPISEEEELVSNFLCRTMTIHSQENMPVSDPSSNIHSECSDSESDDSDIEVSMDIRVSLY